MNEPQAATSDSAELAATAQHADEAASPRAALQTLLARLLNYWQRPADASSPPEAEQVEQRLTELSLAVAGLRLAEVDPQPHPPLLAVLGPTQTGKSTLVNLLTGRSAATVSPLAGFTVHPQGFWLKPPAAPAQPVDPTPTLFDMTDRAAEDEALAWAEALLPGWRRCEPTALARDDLRCYGLEVLPGLAAPLPECVVWDTPDFDSLAARTYREGLLAVAAAADMFVFVLSKEKYSDLSVWRMASLLAPLERPLTIVLNKMTSDAEEAIRRSLRERLEQHGLAAGDVAIETLPYDPHFGESAAQRSEAAQPVRAALTQRWRPLDRAARARGVQALIKRHWETWTAPIAAEHAALDAWALLVGEAGARLLEAYRRDFLDHPQRYDSFRRATVELLLLLELPHVGDALSRVRQIVTWPARRLWASGQQLAEKYRGVRSGATLPSEQAFLHAEIDSLLIGLQRDALRRCEPGRPDAAIWRAVEQRLRNEHEQLLASFRAAARAHHEQVAQEIRAAAAKLYETLRKSPKLLNTLRATRATADAVAIALALKTGGVTPSDLLFAPALLGVTSLLTEGALGTYMQRVASELKESQYEDARTRLVGDVIRAELLKLTDGLDAAAVIGVSRRTLAHARSAVDAWEEASVD